jgi:hypothetical protein
MESDVFIAAYRGLASTTDRAKRPDRPVVTGAMIDAIDR